MEIAKGPDGRSYRKWRSVESDGIERIKERQKAYHAKQREELWQMRAAIGTAQKERSQELLEPALEKLSRDRAQEYERVKAAQRDQRAELRDDQSQGERRRDVLQSAGGAPAQGVHLTPEQIAGYLAYAREVTTRDAERDEAKRELTHADRARSQETGRDPLDRPAREATESSREKTDKDREQEGKRQSSAEWYIAKRKADRDRDRGGGGRDR